MVTKSEAIKLTLEKVDEKRDEIISFLQELVRIPSEMVTGAEREAQSYMEDRFRAMDLTLDVWEPELNQLEKHKAFVPVYNWYPEYQGFKNRPIVVGMYKGQGSGRSLILNGHVDVVPPGVLKNWTFDPWSGEFKDGKVYGRGATDMKGGVVAMTSALQAILKAGINLAGDITIESVVDEEVGGNGTLACLLRGYKADAGIVTEPTALEIHIGHHGHQMFKLEVEGRESHVGLKSKGVNAIFKAQKIMNAMIDWEQAKQKEAKKKHSLFNRWDHCGYPLVFGTIKGGHYVTSPAAECVAKGLYQFLPGDDVNELNKELEEVVEFQNNLDPWLKDHPAKYTPEGMWYEGAEIDPENPIVKTLADSFMNVTQKRGTISVCPSGCDMRIYTLYGDTPSLIFGPGSIEQAHFPNEFIEVEQVIKVTKVLAATIINWCGVV